MSPLPLFAHLILQYWLRDYSHHAVGINKVIPFVCLPRNRHCVESQTLPEVRDV